MRKLKCLFMIMLLTIIGSGAFAYPPGSRDAKLPDQVILNKNSAGKYFIYIYIDIPGNLDNPLNPNKLYIQCSKYGNYDLIPLSFRGSNPYPITNLQTNNNKKQLLIVADITEPKAGGFSLEIGFDAQFHTYMDKKGYNFTANAFQDSTPTPGETNPGNTNPDNQSNQPPASTTTQPKPWIIKNIKFSQYFHNEGIERRSNEYDYVFELWPKDNKLLPDNFGITKDDFKIIHKNKEIHPDIYLDQTNTEIKIKLRGVPKQYKEEKLRIYLTDVDLGLHEVPYIDYRCHTDSRYFSYYEKRGKSYYFKEKFKVDNLMQGVVKRSEILLFENGNGIKESITDYTYNDRTLTFSFPVKAGATYKVWLPNVTGAKIEHEFTVDKSVLNKVK